MLESTSSQATRSRGRWQQAAIETLQLWLDWNDQYQRITEAIYEGHGDLGKMRDLLDHLDQLRYAAASRSRKLLERVPPAFTEPEQPARAASLSAPRHGGG